MKTIFLYVIHFGNAKRYVGVTGDVGKRKRQHRRDKRLPVGRAWERHGATLTVLAKGSEEYILDLERKLIERWNTLRPNGYNRNCGGSHARHTESSKRKISEANRGSAGRGSGWTHTEEAKRKIRAGHLGKKKGPMSDAHKKAIGDALRGRKYKPMSAETKARLRRNRVAPKPVSEETREKLRVATTRWWVSKKQEN